MWSRRRSPHPLSEHPAELGGTPAWLTDTAGDSWLETTGPFQQPGTEPPPTWNANAQDSEPIHYPRPSASHSPTPAPSPTPPPLASAAMSVAQDGEPAPAFMPAGVDALSRPSTTTAAPVAPKESSSIPPPRAELHSAHSEIDAGEASALAAFFAADLLSWSEENPERWYEVISRYLPSLDVRELGWWDGAGRQRVDLALPGRITRRSPDRLTVEVRVRIVPYSRNPRAPEIAITAAPPPSVPDSVTSTAPPPAAAGWRGHEAFSTRMHVPVKRAPSGALVIDAAHLTAQEAL